MNASIDIIKDEHTSYNRRLLHIYFCNKYYSFLHKSPPIQDQLYLRIDGQWVVYRWTGPATDFTIYVKNIQNAPKYSNSSYMCSVGVGVGNRFNYRVSLHIFARNSIYHILRSINQNRCNFSPSYVCLSIHLTRLKLGSRESYSIYVGNLPGITRQVIILSIRLYPHYAATSYWQGSHHRNLNHKLHQ